MEAYSEFEGRTVISISFVLIQTFRFPTDTSCMENEQVGDLNRYAP